MAVKQLSDGNDDGVTLGQSATDKIAFHGSTPVAQQTVTAVATGATAGDLTTTLQALQDALNNLGLVASS